MSKFKTDIKYRINRIIHFAYKYNWKLIEVKDHNYTYINSKYDKIYISLIDLQICTEIKHPKKGNTVMVRVGEFTEKDVESIFRNPRQHTKKSIKSQYVDLKYHLA